MGSVSNLAHAWFMCFVEYSSLVNLIYSGQELFSYKSNNNASLLDNTFTKHFLIALIYSTEMLHKYIALLTVIERALTNSAAVNPFFTTFLDMLVLLSSTAKSH
jgi:hypothetical protein